MILLEHIKEETGESVDSGLADSGYTMKSNFNHTAPQFRSFDHKKLLLKDKFAQQFAYSAERNEEMYQHVSLTEIDEASPPKDSFKVLKIQKCKSVAAEKVRLASGKTQSKK